MRFYWKRNIISVLSVLFFGRIAQVVRVRLVTMCRGKPSGVIARLMSKWSWIGLKCQKRIKNSLPLHLLCCESWMSCEKKNSGRKKMLFMLGLRVWVLHVSIADPIRLGMVLASLIFLFIWMPWFRVSSLKCIIAEMQNICNLIGWDSVHISDIFLLLPCKYQWKVKRRKTRRDIQNIWIYTDLNQAFVGMG